MPTKTTKTAVKPAKPAARKSSTKKSSKRPVKKTGFQKLLAKLGGKGSPLVAIIIVAAVVGLGYFGYVYSSAATNNSQQRTACRDKFPSANKAVIDDCVKRKLAPVKTATAQPVAVGQKISCAALNKVQKTPTQCGPCLPNHVPAGDKCVKQSAGDGPVKNKVDCASLKRVQKSASECGGCIAEHDVSKRDKNACVLINDEDKAVVIKRCAAQNRDYLEYRNFCGPCKTGYFQNGTACSQRNVKPVAQVKAECNAAHRTYNTEANACTSLCVANFSQNTDNSDCIALSTNARKAKTAECNTQNRRYDPQTNSCTTCKPGFLVSGINCVTANPGAIEAIKKNCASTNQAYDPATTSCKDLCVTGFAKDAAGKCITLSGLNAMAAQDLCSKSGLRYNNGQKACSDDCRQGLTKNAAGKCRTPAAIKAECNKDGYLFDALVNACITNKCIKNYTLIDGKCADRVDLQQTMNQRICRALGRVWAEAFLENGESKFVCTEQCTNSTTDVYTQANEDWKSYCKPSNGSTGVLDFSKSKQKCVSEGRLYLTELKACSSLCRAGYYPSANSCLRIVRQDPLNPADVTCEGAIVDGFCLDDDPEPAAPVDSEGRVVSNVEANVKEENCKLLGRVWVKDRKDGDKTIKGGCSTQRCRIAELNVIPRSGSYYCVKSVDRFTKEKCNDLNRRWMPSVEGCAARPHVKDAKKEIFIGAPQCKDATWVYIYDEREAKNGDICVSKSSFQQVQYVAKLAGKPLRVVGSKGAQFFCERQSKKEWHDGQCRTKVIPAPPAVSINNGSNTGSGESTNGGTVSGGGSKAPSGETWSVFCGRIGRSVSGNGCSQNCVDGSKARNPQHLSLGYDYCDPKIEVCSSFGTGGTEPCGGSGGPVRKTITCLDGRSKGYVRYCPVVDRTLDTSIPTKCPTGWKMTTNYLLGFPAPPNLYVDRICLDQG